MTPAIPLEKLNRAELLLLLTRFCRFDQKDIAHCRWEIADQHARDLTELARELWDARLDAALASQSVPSNLKFRAALKKAISREEKGRLAAQKARDRADQLFKALRQYGLDQA